MHKNKGGFASVVAVLVVAVLLVVGAVFIYNHAKVAPALETAQVVSPDVSSGTLVVAVNTDPTTPSANQLVMGSTGNSLAVFRLTATNPAENISVTDLNVVDKVAPASARSTFSNLTLWSGATQVGTAGIAVQDASDSSYIYSFHFANSIIIPAANFISLSLKGDVASYASGGATDDSDHIFKIAPTPNDPANATALKTIVAFGTISNSRAIITLHSASGKTQTVLRSTLAFSASPLGAKTLRVKSPADQFATLSFTANPAGPIAVNQVTVSFGGSAPSSTNFLGGVSLRDENNNIFPVGAISAPCNGFNSCSVTFNLGSKTDGQIISAGSTQTWTLVINSTKTKIANGSNSVFLTSSIKTLASINFTDGLNSSAVSNLSLSPAIDVPINLNSVAFAPGT